MTALIRSWLLFFGVLLALPVMGAAVSAADAPMRLPVDAAILSVADSAGDIKARFSVEIARTDEERSRGLMHRTDLPADRAMLFVFQQQGQRSFWMHNTPLPLDIVYVDAAGAIISIAANTTPFSRAPIPSGLPARYVLEVHAGTADRLNIVVGDRLVHPAIAAGD